MRIVAIVVLMLLVSQFAFADNAVSKSYFGNMYQSLKGDETFGARNSWKANNYEPSRKELDAYMNMAMAQYCYPTYK